MSDKMESKLEQLKALVNDYISGKIDMAAFRKTFVVDFLSRGTGDPFTEFLVWQAESYCADFSEGLMSESDLKAELVQLLYPSVTTGTTNSIQFSQIYTRCPLHCGNRGAGQLGPT